MTTCYAWHWKMCKTNSCPVSSVYETLSRKSTGTVKVFTLYKNYIAVFSYNIYNCMFG